MMSGLFSLVLGIMMYLFMGALFLGAIALIGELFKRFKHRG